MTPDFWETRISVLKLSIRMAWGLEALGRHDGSLYTPNLCTTVAPAKISRMSLHSERSDMLPNASVGTQVGFVLSRSSQGS